MRAGMIERLGEPPVLRELPDPEPAPGEVLVDVECVPLNPIDVAIGSGRFYGGHPPLPFVSGAEAVGRRRDTGERVWVHDRRTGRLAEVVSASADGVVPVPEGADAALAGAAGIAGLAGWLPVVERAPVREEDTVLVLGATSTVGVVALQAARRGGAARIVAAGRKREALERARRLGADEVVTLEGDVDALAARLREACGGDGPTYVVDPLWGEPVVAAARAAARGARIVNVGQSAGPTAALASADVRGKTLDVLGYSNFAMPRAVLEREYRRLVELLTSGEVEIEVERVPLEGLEDAWRRQAAGGAGRKLVVVL